MRYSGIVIFLMVFCLSANVLNGLAEPLGTAVQEFNTPVEAPDFTLEEAGGSKISLKEFRGKVVILNFFTTW